MMSVRLGKNIAYLSLAALMIAACGEKNKTPDVKNDQVQEEVKDDVVVKKGPTIEEQELAEWKGADQNGIAMYAGADRVLFEYDSAELTSEARSILNKQADWLMHYTRVRATVEGHCDERGTREYNLALGERRANAVKNYLIARGVPASRLSSISYGKERPAVVGNGESYWSQNRRGVLVVQ